MFLRNRERTCVVLTLFNTLCTGEAVSPCAEEEGKSFWDARSGGRIAAEGIGDVVEGKRQMERKVQSRGTGAKVLSWWLVREKLHSFPL